MTVITRSRVILVMCHKEHVVIYKHNACLKFLVKIIIKSIENLLFL